MKRVFLTGALTLTTLSALAALLAVQAQDSRRSYQPTMQASEPPFNANKAPVKETDKLAAQPAAISAIRPRPDYDPAKDPRRPGYVMMKEAAELWRAGDLDAAEGKCRKALQFFRTYIANLPKNLPGDATYLLGEPKTILANIQLAKGQYKAALEGYREVTENFSMVHTSSSEYDIFLNVALCYIRLGDYEKAKKFYSDEILLRDSNFSKEDLPGTDNPRALEASILLACGTLANAEGALANYESAIKLAPRNGVLAYRQAMLLMRLKRYDEALPMFARAVRFGTGEDAKDAKNRMGAFPATQCEAAMQAAAKIP